MRQRFQTRAVSEECGFADLIVLCLILRSPSQSPSHTPPKKIGEAARDSVVRSLLLSHLAPDVLGQEAAVRKSIRATYAGPVAFASDKVRVPIGK